MSIQRWVLTSCSIRFIGNTGASISGLTGAPLGPSGGNIGVGRSAARLYHLRGISFSESRIFTLSIVGFLVAARRSRARAPAKADILRDRAPPTQGARSLRPELPAFARSPDDEALASGRLGLRDHRRFDEVAG